MTGVRVAGRVSLGKEPEKNEPPRLKKKKNWNVMMETVRKEKPRR